MLVKKTSLLNKKYIEFQRVNIIVLALIPIISSFVMCALQGKTIADIYLPSSYWNDELFYFKQVEAMRYYGIPQGFYGYNESHAALLSFASWSPILLVPWFLYSTLFGWNFMSPIICNIIFLSFSLVLFGILVKPSRKQIILFLFAFLAFPPVTRWMLSGTPEVICIAFLIVYMSVVIKNNIEYNGRNIIVLFLLGIFMTWMRPYFLLLMIFPVIQIKRKKNGWLFSLFTIIIALFGYMLISKYLCASYLIPIVNISWLKEFDEGIISGIVNMILFFMEQLTLFIKQLYQGLTEFNIQGTLSISYIALFILILSETIRSYKNKDKQNIFLFGAYTICLFCLLVAIFYLYTLVQGSRHMISFIMCGLLLLCLYKQYSVKKMIILIVFFGIIFGISIHKERYTFEIPFREKAISESLEKSMLTLSDKMKLQGKVPTYDNTVIWVYSDKSNGEEKILQWQLLYAIPKGFGINLCTSDYILENINNLSSRYIAVIPNGDIEKKCIAMNARCIDREEEMAIYDIKMKE